MFFSMRSKSPPAENTLPPAPWMITQLTVSSPSMSRHTLTSSVCMIESVALYLSGRFMVTRSTLGCGRSNSRRSHRSCPPDIEVPSVAEEPTGWGRATPVARSAPDVARAPLAGVGEAHGLFRRANQRARLQHAFLELGFEVGGGVG